MVLEPSNIHEYRLKPTFASYTFQPIINLLPNPFNIYTELELARAVKFFQICMVLKQIEYSVAFS